MTSPFTDKEAMYQLVFALVDKKIESTIFIRCDPDKGVMVATVKIEPTEDLVGVAKTLEQFGLTLAYDGNEVRIVQPPPEPPPGLPIEVTPDPDPPKDPVPPEEPIK